MLNKIEKKSVKVLTTVVNPPQPSSLSFSENINYFTNFILFGSSILPDEEKYFTNSWGGDNVLYVEAVYSSNICLTSLNSSSSSNVYKNNYFYDTSRGTYLGGHFHSQYTRPQASIQVYFTKPNTIAVRKDPNFSFSVTVNNVLFGLYNANGYFSRKSTSWTFIGWE